jgi:hypothetical protein
VNAASYTRRHWNGLAAVQAGLWLTGAGSQAQPARGKMARGKRMIQLTLLRTGRTDSLEPRRQAITAGKRTMPSRAAAGAPGYLRAFGNERLNSRLGRELGEGEWVEKWREEIRMDGAPAFVLSSSGFIVVHGSDWQIRDAPGKAIASGRLGPGQAVIDPALRSVFTFTEAGYLTLRRLADGGPLFQFLPVQGDGYIRTFLTRRGSRLLVAGWESMFDPHGRFQPSKSVLQIQGLGTPPLADEFGLLSTAERVGELYVEWPAVRVAAAEEQIVCALPNELFRMNWEWEIPAIYEGEFDPRSLSLDEAGNIYLLCTAGGASHLWVINAKGERVVDFALPGDPQTLLFPPVIGYGHTAYLLAQQHIYAVGPDGKLQWSRAAHGGAAGAAVTLDDKLLTSEGACIVVYDAKGERRSIACFPGETLSTPPILTEAGEMLVASETVLHCLSPK